MELTHDKAKDMDDILAHAVEKGFPNGFNVYYYVRSVRPDLTNEYVFHLAALIDDYMKRYGRHWIILDNGKTFTCNNNTKAFLDSGGFQKIYEIEKAQQIKEETDLKLAQATLRDYPITKWIARIGFIIALALAIIELIRFAKGR